MHIIRIGRHRFNLEFLIRDERGDGLPGTKVPPGVVRVVMSPGEHIDLSGPDAEQYLKSIAEAERPEPEKSGLVGTESARINPPKGLAGAPGRALRKRKQGG